MFGWFSQSAVILFFGLAIQAYESTLISDDTPYDRYLDGKPGALTDLEFEGLQFFRRRLCATCHVDPELTLAAWVWTESDMHVSNPSWAPTLNSIATGVGAGAQSWPVTTGTLVIDISDTKSKNGVWRGTASDTLNHAPTGNKAKDAKNAEKPIKKAVEKMFKKFPRP